MQSFHTCIRCCVRATNTSVCIDSVDKQDTILNTQWHCFDLLYRLSRQPFNVHSNYNADSNTKTLNYSKVRFKPLIYFELEQTLN